MMVWGEILLKKEKKRKKKKGEKKENLLKIEHGFGYGLTHGLSMLFFLFLKITFALSFFFFKKTIVSLIYLFVYWSFLCHHPSFPPLDSWAFNAFFPFLDCFTFLFLMEGIPQL